MRILKLYVVYPILIVLGFIVAIIILPNEKKHKKKKMDKELEQVYEKISKTWGIDSQMNMMSEEIGELLQAMNKYRRAQNKSEEEKAKAYDHLCEEIADVENMINQFRYIFDSDLIDKYKEQKLRRALDKLNKK